MYQYLQTLDNNVNCSLYLRLQCMIYDLLHLDRVDWDKRLMYTNSITSIHLSSLYFSSNEQQLLYTFPSPNGLLFHELANSLLNIDSTNTKLLHHDLANIYRQVFQLKHTFYQIKNFKKKQKVFNQWCREKMNRLDNLKIMTSIEKKCLENREELLKEITAHLSLTLKSKE